MALAITTAPQIAAQRHNAGNGNQRTERNNGGRPTSGRPTGNHSGSQSHGRPGNNNGNNGGTSRPGNGNTRPGNSVSRPGNSGRPNTGSGRPEGTPVKPTPGHGNVNPSHPVRPVAPAAPAAPGRPVRPVAPARPVAPSRPVRPTRPAIMQPPHRPYRPVMVRPHYRPVPPPAWRPLRGVPPLRTILGLTFGSAIGVSLDYLLNSGYTVDGYGNDIVYLRNVPLMNFIWTDGALYYGQNGLDTSSFYYSTPGYDMSRYNGVYGALVNQYGAPVSVDRAGGMLTSTWFGGNNGFITLSFGAGQAGRYMTTLTVGL